MSFFSELKRRNVFKVAAAYVIVGWPIMQVGDVMAPAMHLPDWVQSALAFFLILGFPVALIRSWAFEMTPEGTRLERNVEVPKSFRPLTGRRLDFAIIILPALAVGFFAYDKFMLGPTQKPVEAGQVAKELNVDRDYALSWGGLADAHAQRDGRFGFPQGSTAPMTPVSSSRAAPGRPRFR